MRSIHEVRSPSGRLDCARRAALAVGTLLGGLFAGGGAASARPSLVTLIDLSGVNGGPAIPSCPSALSQLRDALDGVGIPTQRVNAPTGDTLRLTLAQIGAQALSGRMIVVCGYGAAPNGQVFVLPTDASGRDGDISRAGVSADTLSRVAGSGSLTALELHPLPGHDLPDAVVGKWQESASPGTSRLAGVDTNADEATLLTRLTAAVKGQGDAMLGAFFGVTQQTGSASPASEAPATPAATAAPKPPEPTPTETGAAGASALGTNTPQAPSSAATAHSSVGKQAAGHSATATNAPTPAETASKAATSSAPVSAPPVSGPAAAEPSAPSASGTSGAASTAAAGSAAAPASTGASPTAAPPAPAPKRPAPARRNPPAHRTEAAKTDPQIRSLQLGLLAAGVYHGTVTGKDSAATTHAVQLYQQKLGHPPTGQLSPEERKALTGG